MSVRFLYITAPDREQAESLGRFLVESRLAACVNILGGMNSLYWWAGEVQSDSEVVCIAKTTEALAEEATRQLVERHPYDTPCVVALDVSSGNPEFLQWVARSVGPRSESG